MLIVPIANLGRGLFLREEDIVDTGPAGELVEDEVERELGAKDGRCNPAQMNKSWPPLYNLKTT